MERKKPTQMEVTELYAFRSWNRKKDIAFYRGEEMDGLSSGGQKGNANLFFPPCFPLSNCEMEGRNRNGF